MVGTPFIGFASCGSEGQGILGLDIRVLLLRCPMLFGSELMVFMLFDVDVDFLAVVEHELILARVRSG